MNKHTPGPWYLAGNLPGIRHKVHCHPSGHDWSVAHVCNGNNADANARLIAAAPELLDALLTLMENAENVDGLGFNMFAVTKARRAISKATWGKV